MVEKGKNKHVQAKKLSLFIIRLLSTSTCDCTMMWTILINKKEKKIIDVEVVG